MWLARAIALVVGAVMAMSCSTPPEPDEAQGWTSVVWRVAEAAFAPDRPTTVTEVEWFGPGAIVIGDGPNPNPNPDGLVTTATGWRSADLDAWEGWTIADGLRVDDVAAIADVAAGPLGALAIGGTCCRTEEASAWWSSDGRDWRRAHVPIDDHATVSFLEVATGPDGFVIAGTADGGAAIWASADGRDWHLLTPDGAPVRQGAANGVARVGDRWVGVGFEDEGIDANGVVWLGRTLDDWARLADRDPALTDVDEVVLEVVHGIDGGLVALGGRGTQAARVRCERGGGDCGWHDQSFWLSDDGRDWTRVERPTAIPPDRTITAFQRLEPSDGGLLALADELGGSDGTIEGLSLWWSSDGSTWRRLRSQPDLSITDSILDLAVSEDRLIAVGGSADPAGGRDLVTVWLGVLAK